MKKLNKIEVLELLEKLNLKNEISIDEIDGFLLKQMAMSNIIKSNRPSTDTGKQTHIALTSHERSLFPLVSSVTYYENEEKPKFYDFKLPVKLLRSNIEVLDTENIINFEDESLETYTLCYIRKDASGFQVQLSKTREDEENFIKFRKLMFENDYLGIIKLKGKLRFIFLAYKESSINVSDKSILYIDEKSNTLLSEDDLYKETDQKPILGKKTTIDLLSEEEVLILSLYLSKFSDKALNYLKVKSWKEAYIKISEKSEEYSNFNSINNLRDSFDFYFNNGREGWHQRKLIPKYKNVLDKYRDLEQGQLEYIIGLFWLGKTSKINQALNRIIYGAPGTGKSYQLDKEAEGFYKVEKREIVSEDENEISEPNYWIATCGEQNKLWNEFQKGSIFAVGWDQLGDLKQFKTNKEVREKLESLGHSNKKADNQWYIANSLKKGDIIAIRKGIKGVIEGYGEITGDYYHDSTRNSYQQTIPVKWINNEVVELSTYNRSFPIQTLVPMNKDLKISFKNECLGIDTTAEYEKIKMSTVERVTFYDGYTHGQFVGSYKPVPKGESITYEYVAGPLMRQLIEAYKNPNNEFCLIIEEINRARADKVFGNIFQLLDRKEDGDSQYPIALSQEQENYLEEKLESEDINILKRILENGLFLPNNLYIWATMNSADQGVYALDSAFKRRWNFEHIGLDDNEDKFFEKDKIPGVLFQSFKYKADEDPSYDSISWNAFRHVINKRLLKNKVLEDRLIAPFFVKSQDFLRGEDEVHYISENLYELNENIFIDKVLMYLFDDVLKHKKKSILFKDDYDSFSELKNGYRKKDLSELPYIHSIFEENLRKELEEISIRENLYCNRETSQDDSNDNLKED